MEIELTLPDGRPRCPKPTKKGQCRNPAGFKTSHEGSGFCTYHDGEPTSEMLTPAGMPIGMPAKIKQPKPIYHKGLVKGDPKRLLQELSGQSTQQSLSLKEELGAARAMLLQLQQSVLPIPVPEGSPPGTKPFQPGVSDSFYSDVARLLDVIGKLSERSQPRSTLTVSNVQTVLMKVVEVVSQEVGDQVVVERIINKLSSIVLVQK